jgi:hypothetical protein
MSERGSYGTPANVYMWGSAFVPASGQPGAEGVTTGSATKNTSVAGGSPDVQGKPKTARGTGGGGSGSVRKVGTSPTTTTSLAGSAGTSWSGGFGSGGVSGFNVNATGFGPTSQKGGDARVVSSTSQANTIYVGGGSGVIGGDGVSRGGTTTLTQTEPPYAAVDGTAGLLMIACLGAMTNNGSILSVGTSGGTGSVDHGNGGASGGGSINIVASSIGGTGGTTSVDGGVGTTAGFDSVNIGDNTGGAGGAGSYTAQTFTQESINTLPRRTLFYSGSVLYYYDFNASTWQIAGVSGTTPYQSVGMFDAEVYALTSTQIANIPNYNASDIRIRTYQP